ncbi:class I SAM-dependent DNA methyltransferase [Rubricoccus marinus]|uniref:site-specific DNA-methyltransferase (adenine-specific) n=1 Tax=Rubricoccus marinus TaxID=716817 RepID=A0A259TXG8_9BACT|nr:DNA methyltransferase [Rubricoccus marinus]OZC02390.1 hypothetical protein BSZ36_05010 [Rubricoccus marinus]
MNPTDFIAKWRASGASERSNYALFFSELADVLGVPRPDPATDTPEADGYVIDRVVTTESGATNYIDLYRRACFVAEAKQGSDAPEATEAEKLGMDAPKRRRGTARRGTRGWETAMQKAKGQARRYARALPEADGWPPFLMVVDVGYCFDLYADFSGQGKAYVSFPNQQSYRIMLEDLEDEEVRETLRRVWMEPLALDPQRRSVAATRDLAKKLAKLAKSLEDAGNESDAVADFLLRSLFTMFAEDVKLLPEASFSDLLRRYRDRPETASKAIRSLWQTMKTGGFDGGIGDEVRHFNGPLFDDPSAPELTSPQLDLLIEAADAVWTDVEPSIFGTLIEQALNPIERHRLGAHYTPRAYVERLVVPTVVEPLREEWEAAQAAAQLEEDAGNEAAARDELVAFHRRLCSVRVLDPACGTANFLYVTLEHLKRLEGEVLDAIAQYPGQQTLDMTGGLTVSPGQLLGIEFNARAASIARVVLYIGYLQWHYRTFGNADRLDAPILRDYRTIEHRDAVLDAADREPAYDEQGNRATRWDGRTMKPNPADPTELVPDPSARVPAYRYVDPKPAAWPEAEFLVGNPPFVGSQKMRGTLGDGYTEALRSAYKDEVPGSADLVMYWWHKAAEAVREGSSERFGLITTNSAHQKHNRAVIANHLGAKPPLSLAFAVRDHPWTYDPEGAAVRIAMTVGVAGEVDGRLATVVREERTDELGQSVELAERVGAVWSDLAIGADVAGAAPLEANRDLSFMGVKLVQPRGNVPGFTVTQGKARDLGLGAVEGAEAVLPRYRSGNDVTKTNRDLRVIDFFGMTAEAARERFPDAYQHVLTYVKPFRDQNGRPSRRENWWLHGESLPAFRQAVAGISRYIATVETSKHRLFTFLDADILPDGGLILVCLDDAYALGVLSSRYHVVWALRAGGRLEDRPRYNPTRTFQPFPFPAADKAQTQRIREAGEAVYRQREARREAHPSLTLTDVYNVLEALSDERELTKKERAVYEAGAVGVLRELHAELDAAVAEAYGWPNDLEDAEVIERLVALNAERAEEEALGRVRYLRPSHQNPDAGDQAGLDIEVASKPKKASAKKEPWPRSTRERIAAVRRAVERLDRPAAPKEVAKSFSRARADDVADVLDALDALGHLHRDEEGRYAA